MKFTNVVASPETALGAVAFILAASGFLFVYMVTKNEKSVLVPYLIQILGLCFILPVVLLVSVLADVQTEAVTGLLGTIVGYIFGTSRQTQNNDGDS